MATDARAAGTMDPDLPDRPFDIGDLYLADGDKAANGTEDGAWFCPWAYNGQVPPSPGRNCPNEQNKGGSSLDAVQNLLAHVRANHGRIPRLLRVGKARKTCPINSSGQVTDDDACRTGVPAGSFQCHAGGQAELAARLRNAFCWMLDLKGLHTEVGGGHGPIGLGVIMGSVRKVGDVKTGRPVRELATHACEIHKADIFGLYDFMFLDEAKYLEANIKPAVRHIRAGEIWDGSTWVKCTYQRFLAGEQDAGWDVITNDNGWDAGAGNQGYTLNTQAWGHAKALKGMTGHNLANDIRDSRTDPIRPADRQFINAVHEADDRFTEGKTRAVLRFEVANQTEKLATWFTPPEQRKMIRKFAGQQQRTTPDDFTLIYPLYVHGNAIAPTSYDSTFSTRNTFVCQMALIATFGIQANSPGNGPSGKPPQCA